MYILQYICIHRLTHGINIALLSCFCYCVTNVTGKIAKQVPLLLLHEFRKQAMLQGTFVKRWDLPLCRTTQQKISSGRSKTGTSTLTNNRGLEGQLQCMRSALWRRFKKNPSVVPVSWYENSSAVSRHSWSPAWLWEAYMQLWRMDITWS